MATMLNKTAVVKVLVAAYVARGLGVDHKTVSGMSLRPCFVMLAVEMPRVNEGAWMHVFLKMASNVSCHPPCPSRRRTGSLPSTGPWCEAMRTQRLISWMQGPPLTPGTMKTTFEAALFTHEDFVCF